MIHTRYTYIIIFGLLGIFILGALYFFWYTAPEETPLPRQEKISGQIFNVPTPIPRESEIVSPTLPEEIAGVPEQKLLQLTDFSIVSPSLNPKEDRILFYKKDGGDLLSYDFSGKEPQKIANITIVGILEALWSPQKDRAAVFYLDGETLKAFLHIGTSSVAVLPQNIGAFSWSPDGASLVYLPLDEVQTSLVVSDAAGRNQRIIYRLPIPETHLQWVSDDKISLYTAPSGLAEGFLFLFSSGSGTLTKIARGFGLEALWSPNGSLVLVSTTSSEGKNIRLSLLDAGGKESWSPGVAALAHKCVWVSPSEIYCAVPRFIPPQSIWPDDYLRGAFHTADRIIALDIDKKEVREVFAESTFDISNLTVTEKKDYLFFVNRRDGTLWRYKFR